MYIKKEKTIFVDLCERKPTQHTERTLIETHVFCCILCNPVYLYNQRVNFCLFESLDGT
jgi:hypothetical protein